MRTLKTFALVAGLMAMSGCSATPLLTVNGYNVEPFRAPGHVKAKCQDELNHDADAQPWTATNELIEGHGFGLNVADQAWVCAYRPGAGPGEPVELDASKMFQVYAWLATAAPVEPVAACTMDMGPSWVVTQRHVREITSVRVDDYGCREMRATKSPLKGFGPAADRAAQSGLIETLMTLAPA